MTGKKLQTALDALIQCDLVAELASKLIAEGMTEEQVVAALKQCPRIPDLLKVELQNKYRDIAHSGWTTNRFQRKWTQ